MKRYLILVPVLILLMLGGHSMSAEGAKLAEGVAVTIYNQGLGLVKDYRHISVPLGVGEVRLSDVAALIDPTSVHFRSLTDEATAVLEQNFEYDLVSEHRLLEKYLGQEIELLGDDGSSRRVTLLSFQGSTLVVMDGENLLIDPPGRIRLPRLPEGLITKPTLAWLLRSQTGGNHLVELTYLTKGLTWRADYVGVVDDENRISLNGWVTLENHSGTSYEDAKLQLVAGDINLVSEEVGEAYDVMAERKLYSAAPVPQFQEEEFFEYHLYTLDRKTTIKDRQIKQVGLLAASDVKAKRVYVVEGNIWHDNETPVKVMLETRNSEANGLGMPLPKGKVRIYKADSAGNLQFVGEDLIAHTPKDEQVRLYLGNAFDVKAELATVNRRDRSSDSVEFTREVKVRNHKDEPVQVIVTETIRGDWDVLEAGADYNKRDAYTLEFLVDVGANAGKEFTYRILVQ